MADAAFVLLSGYQEYSTEEMKRRGAEFYSEMRGRRTVREFSQRPVPREVIADYLRADGTAPNGANMQPWRFVVVSDAGIKRKIRVAAEKEEYEFYHHKAPKEWLDALAPLGTNEHKPFLENAPCLIVIFAQSYGVILVVGYPAEGAKVPRITKKSLEEIVTFRRALDCELAIHF
jgi:iodotyrosine deiodinase